MDHYLNYEGGRISFSLPSQWSVICDQEMPPAPVVSDVRGEINRALDNPIGSPAVEKLARPGMNVVLLFDDQQRPTPAHLALPEIMDRLNRAGVTDDRISAVCAMGTHPVPNQEQLREKVGDEVLSRLGDRVTRHDPRSADNVVMGRTRRNVLVEINRTVAQADLVIGVGQCMPHPGAGYSGGHKIIMPGVSSYRAVAEHHFSLLSNEHSTANRLDGNPFWEEIVDAGRLAKLAFKLDFVIDERKRVIKAFAGDPEAEQREAAHFAEALYLVVLPREADITITSAAPLEMGVQATKALAMATRSTRSGGAIVWVASQKQAGPILPLIREMATPLSASEVRRNFQKGEIPDHLLSLGISYIAQIASFKEFSEKFKIVHVTEGLTPEQVGMMGMTYSNDLQNAVDNLAHEMPRANVAIFPSGGNVIPEIR